MPDLETMFRDLSNNALRAIIADDATRCAPHECWHGKEGYAARVTIGRRITWAIPCPVTGEIIKREAA
ncbi:hypothetical protein vBCbaSRXM_20 [Citromicrobium phage vB_CbaS-RXM]|nr:hypothetical protein vBCbaSRXM_20 [Citromicrobium phage vB_CbaS-RXM]